MNYLLNVYLSAYNCHLQESGNSYIILKDTSIGEKRRDTYVKNV